MILAMRFVVELLLSTASCENQVAHVILVGDGKIYQHLIEIKQTYRIPLKFTHLFQGWHRGIARIFLKGVLILVSLARPFSSSLDVLRSHHRRPVLLET